MALVTPFIPYRIPELKSCAITAACWQKKGMEDIFDFYNRFEKIAVKTLSEEKGANMCSNVDYYSGFAYNMLGIPRDLYTPLFVISRIVGWLAHNIEHKLYDNRIVRPAAKYVGDLMDYIPMEDR